MLKSKARERLTEPRLSIAEDDVPKASIPLSCTCVKFGPKPRNEICRPSPPSRVMAMPGTRCSESARFRSGKSAISSATIESCAPTAFRFKSFAFNKLLR